MEIIIIYKSKTGFTEQYAKWIAEELGSDAVSLQKVTMESLKPYKMIIYGGGITAGQIGGLKKLNTLMSAFPEKKLIVFATGATPAEVFKLTDEIKNPFFYFQSGINYERMNMAGRLLMRTFTLMLANKKNKTPEEQGMVEMIKQSSNYSDRKYIEPLVKYVRGEK